MIHSEKCCHTWNEENIPPVYMNLDLNDKMHEHARAGKRRGKKQGRRVKTAMLQEKMGVDLS